VRLGSVRVCRPRHLSMTEPRRNILLAESN
jgi:hypothetical protein